MTKKIKLKKYGDTVWHPESRLVFKSRKEKCVVGRLDEKEELIVDDKMVELSDQWNFKVDPDIIESAEESGEDPASTALPGLKLPDASSRKSSTTDLRVDLPLPTKRTLLAGDTSNDTAKADQRLGMWQEEMEKGSTLLRKLNRMYERQCQENEKLQLELKIVKNERDEISNKMSAIKSLFS